MSRTDLDATTLANSLRMRTGDGSVEWVTEPMQSSVLLDIADMLDEHAKLREQTELLVTLLRNDCDIEASWDGLRHFWSIELTDDGCLMRDRACKAEAENAKLREFIKLKEMCWKYVGFCDACPYNGVDDEHDDCNCTVQEEVNSLASELGIEVGV